MNTGTNIITNNVDAFYDRTLLEAAFPRLIHGMFAQKRMIPRNSGSDTIRFRRYENLSPSTTALVEGVTPNADTLTITNLTATIKQYGAWVSITDKVDFINIDPVMTETTIVQGRQAGQTLDRLTREVLAAGTSVSYSGTGNTDRDEVAAGDKISAADIKNAVLKLKLNNADKLMEMIKPTDGVSTTPVDAAYVGFVHPNITATLKGLPEFTPIEKYSSHMTMMPGEVGKLDECRFVETTEAKVFTGEGTGGVDIYATIILGANAYAETAITGEEMKSIRKPFGSGQDPLNQRATLGWKATHVAKILNDDFMTRIESAAA